MQLIDTHRLATAKRANSARRFDLGLARTLVTEHGPKAGDLVLARVTKTGHHDGVEEPSGRRASLYPGDEILVVYGNRYAPDQFEAVVPDSLGPCHLVAAGGLAATALSWHSSMRAPTEITPIGLVGDSHGRPLNLYQFRLQTSPTLPNIPVIISIGTSMNSGKTTSAARLIHGLSKLGLRVGAAKVTGTSAGKDTWLMRDSGAASVYDFNDAGFATTYLVPTKDVEQCALRLVNALAKDGCEVAVVEIADGLLQPETRELLTCAQFRQVISSIVFSSVDSMGAVAGATWLQSVGHTVTTLAGVMTNSPLAAREAASATGLKISTLKSLQDAAYVSELFPCIAPRAGLRGSNADAA